MKVLFIGGTGNLSTACTRRALAKNMEVFHLNRGTRQGRTPPGVTELRGDIRNPAEVGKALGGLRFDSVVQFLAFSPEHIEADMEMFQGITGQYVFISSASVYKRPSLHPVITEATPLENPYWDYAQLKIACEETLTRKGREKGFPYTIIRPSHTYDDGWILSQFVSVDFGVAWRMLSGLEVVAAGDGQSVWTVTHASDFAKGLVGLLGNPAALGEAFHITSDEFLTWNAILTMIGAALGVKPKIAHIPSEFIMRVLPHRGVGLLGDKGHSCIFDNSKIRRFVPGFRPEIHFAEGIRRSIDWYNARPELKVPNQTLNAEFDKLLDCWNKALALAETLKA
ncbi:MAG: SDR family oxidoreductase [Spirochaetales bacterium]|jgi:nucleoside-diphosphate-sugar epimerase|nr:SDR family oxidoreductase [Spirochaetales bacterium]